MDDGDSGIFHFGRLAVPKGVYLILKFSILGELILKFAEDIFG